MQKQEKIIYVKVSDIKKIIMETGKDGWIVTKYSPPQGKINKRVIIRFWRPVPETSISEKKCCIIM